MIQRPKLAQQIETALARSRAVALLGPRQCGKTTLARQFVAVDSVKHANLGKLQIKSPKVYLRDSDILHHLLGIRTHHDLLLHPKVGASWEGYAVEEVIIAVAPDGAFFWGMHGGVELDLLLLKDGRRLGVECKRVDAPKLTPSMRIALDDLNLDHLVVIYPGARAYPLAERVTVLPLIQVADGSRALTAARRT